MRLPAALCASLLFACAGEEPPHLLYSTDPSSLENPFPDLRLQRAEVARPDWYQPFLPAAAKTGEMKALLRRWSERARTLDGVGNYAPTLLLASAPLDRDSLPDGRVTRLRKVGDGYEVLEDAVRVEHSADRLDEVGVAVPAGFPEFLLAQPMRILREGEEGLLVVRRGWRTADGEPLGRGRAVEGDELSRARIRAAAAALGVPESDVLLALPQKAQSSVPTLQALATWTTQTQVPSYDVPAHGVATVEEGGQERTRPVGVWTPGDGDWGQLGTWLERHPFGSPADAVAKVVIGTYKSRDLRGEDGEWVPAWIADPLLAPEVDVGFVLTLPPGERPEGGYRVIIGGHGLNGRNVPRWGDGDAFCLELAQWLAEEGLACLGIDAAYHGTRGAIVDFFSVPNPLAARDNFRQTAFDLLQLTRTAQVMDVDDAPGPDLGELGYFGGSLGALVGGVEYAYDPRLAYAVLYAAGGGFSNILVSPDIRDKYGLLLVAESRLVFTSPEYYAAFAPLRVMGQHLTEAGDPMVASQALGPKAVLLQEMLNDITIPNRASEDLAANLGLGLATVSTSGTAPLRVLTQSDPAQYLTSSQVERYNGHNLFWDAAPVRRQTLDFLVSRGMELHVE